MMKKYTNKILKILPYVTISILVGVIAVYASSTTSLTPLGPASNTMYSLTDIYNLAEGTTSTEGQGSIETTPSVSLSGRSLTDVYLALSTEIAKLSPSVIKSGTTAFGKIGEVSSSGANLSNMYNGTCGNGATACPSGEFLGGSQANGGVDDANYGPEIPMVPPTDRYETDWTICSVGNNYCGTGDLGANAKDEATGLVWSYPLTGLGGSTFDTEVPIPDPYCLEATYDEANCYMDTDTLYSWDNSYGDNNNKTASQLCSDHTGWSFPHQKQLLQAYIDGAYGNLEIVGVSRSYWSATTNSLGSSYAFQINFPNGANSGNFKYAPYNVRCVR